VKDQYACDINDYLKYAFLRTIAPDERRTEIVWMLTAHDGGNDGKRLDYLGQPERFRVIDPPLFDALQHLVAIGSRTVQAVEEAGILPNVFFVAGELCDRLSDRDEYMSRAFAAAGMSTFIFFDPDNGVGVPSVPKGRRNSSKYVYSDEVTKAYRLGQSSVSVYQHFPYRPRLPLLRSLADTLLERTDSPAMLVLSTPYVAYLVLPQPSAERRLYARMQELSHRAETLRTTLSRFVKNAPGASPLEEP
jgi:hypothetical protein